MKHVFCYENGTSQLILIPTDQRDRTQLTLCTEGRPEIRIKPTTDESIILEFSEPATVKDRPGKEYVTEAPTQAVPYKRYIRESCLCNGAGCTTCEPKGRG